MPSVLVPVANGSEEMEVVIIVDILRRAEWNVVVASVEAMECVCSRHVRLLADMLFDDVDPDAFDILVLPGGAGGADAFRRNSRMLDMIRSFAASHRYLAAICAAPLVLQEAGVLTNVPATCHPSVRDQLTQATIKDKAVVIHERIITGRGPGAAIEFALALVAQVSGEEAAATIAKGLAG